MNAIRSRAPLAAVVLSCLFTASPAFAEAAAADPWARVPQYTALCYQSTGQESDPFNAKLESAKAAIRADREKQDAINARIEEDFRNIDPMEMASRMQQWMMDNPQEAMAYVQSAQAAPAEVEAEIQSLEQQRTSRAAQWNALLQAYGDARIQAYAPAEARRKALAAKVGYVYSGAREDLLQPTLAFVADPSTARADWNEGEALNGEFDRAYQALCPQWWGANGKLHAYLKAQKDWFIRERIPYLEKFDAPRLQQYAIMSTPTAAYRSTATLQAVGEYLDLTRDVLNARDVRARCTQPRDCDGTYP